MTNQPDREVHARRDAKIVRRRPAGQTYEEIQSALGLRGYSTVSRILARAGPVRVKKRRRGRRRLPPRRTDRATRVKARAARDRRIVKMYTAEKPSAEIAKAVKASTVDGGEGAAVALSGDTGSKRRRGATSEVARLRALGPAPNLAPG